MFLWDISGKRNRIRANPTLLGRTADRTAVLILPASDFNMAESVDLDFPELLDMVLGFRVFELKQLLGFAGECRTGNKWDLQKRALDLLSRRSAPINAKVRELNMQQANLAMGQSSEVVAAASNDLPNPSTSAGSSQQMLLSTRIHCSVSATEQSTTGNNIQVPLIPPATVQSSSFPVHPDVKLKSLPFFDILAELVRPSTLVPQSGSRYHEANFVIHLTAQQATDVASSRDARPGSKINFINQIQMRFCHLETSCEQEDNFPAALSAKVNGKLVTLPDPIPTNRRNVQPKRPPRPVNVTSLCKLSPTVANRINVTWSSDRAGRGYVVSVCIVQKLSSSDLLQRLRDKGVRPADCARRLIRDKLTEDADAEMEIATTSLKVSRLSAGQNEDAASVPVLDLLSFAVFRRITFPADE